MSVLTLPEADLKNNHPKEGLKTPQASRFFMQVFVNKEYIVFDEKLTGLCCFFRMLFGSLRKIPR